MGIFSGMTDKTAPRGFKWIWYIRIVQLLGTLIVIGLAALHASLWSNCSVPSKIAWNLACGVISLLVLIYFFLSTGPSRVFKLLPWIVWGQLALDALMLIFWLSASATSTLNCNDYCNACPDYRQLEWNNLLCYCPYNSKRDTSPAPRGLAGLLEPRRSRGSGGSSSSSGRKLGSVAARTAVNAIMTVLFAITLASTIWWILSHRKSAGTAAPIIPPPTQAEAGNAGFPLTSNQQPAPAYSQPQMGEQYGQGQPQHQQPVYDQTNPQGQYPSQPQPMAYQTGAPAQY